MKIVLSKADVNSLKMCPVCKTLYIDGNYCPRCEEKVELLEVEVEP